MPQLKKRRLRADPAICDAASVGDMRTVRRLLAEGVDPDTSDEDGVTALMASAFAAQPGVVRALLQAGADPDAQDASGLTALMNAVIANGEMDQRLSHPIFVEIVVELLAAGADPALADADGCTAADHAREGNLADLARLLEGAD